MKWVANSGVGPMYNNFHDWPSVTGINDKFNAIRATHGWHPVPPSCSGPIYVAETKEKAEYARRWYRDIIDSSIWHYGIFNQPSMRALTVGKTGAELDAAIESIYANSMKTGVFGTPDEVIEKLSEIQNMLGIGHLQGHFDFGRMPHDVAKANVELFAKEVMPALRELPEPEMRSTSYAEVVASRAKEAKSPVKV
jgi:alkanesulfonate monooxygenase SsuD/methylene tetrahydromethanopterin reductase-like flavin-dependent oxidoreductase (luciferase family)